jgi:hypothetical protein
MFARGPEQTFKVHDREFNRSARDLDRADGPIPDAAVGQHMHSYVFDALQFVNDIPGGARRGIIASEASEVAGSDIAKEAGRTPRQPRKIVGTKIGFDGRRHELGSEYLKTCRVLGQRVTDDAASIATRCVLERAKLVLRNEPGLFHIAQHYVSERRVRGERRVSAKFSKSLLRLSPEAGSKFIQKLLLKQENSPLWPRYCLVILYCAPSLGHPILLFETRSTNGSDERKD